LPKTLKSLFVSITNSGTATGLIPTSETIPYLRI
jgi:hypothetical protein